MDGAMSAVCSRGCIWVHEWWEGQWEDWECQHRVVHFLDKSQSVAWKCPVGLVVGNCSPFLSLTHVPIVVHSCH
jgi:hypothetical protein